MSAVLDVFDVVEDEDIAYEEGMSAQRLHTLISILEGHHTPTAIERACAPYGVTILNIYGILKRLIGREWVAVRLNPDKPPKTYHITAKGMAVLHAEHARLHRAVWGESLSRLHTTQHPIAPTGRHGAQDARYQ